MTKKSPKLLRASFSEHTYELGHHDISVMACNRHGCGVCHLKLYVIEAGNNQGFGDNLSTNKIISSKTFLQVHI